MFCPQCGLRQPQGHRFCMGCGLRIPADVVARRGPKISRWFWGVPVAPTDPPDAALRVTRYVEAFRVETPDGSATVPSNHVRFSIWNEDHAECAISIPDHEAEALAAFLLSAVPSERPAAR